jgi:hypothetical protein
MSPYLAKIARGLVLALTALTKLASSRWQLALGICAVSFVFIMIWPVAGAVALVASLFVMGILTDSKPEDHHDNR